MPKATRLDHIAIAVRDIDAGIEKWTTLRAGVRSPHREPVGPLRREVC